MLTGPEPGLTRDAVAVDAATTSDGPIELVDTAGLRRKARIEAPLEKLAVGAAIGALKMAEVVVLVVDATEGLHDQDLQIAPADRARGPRLRARAEQVGCGGGPARRAPRRSPIGWRPAWRRCKGMPVVPLSAMTGVGHGAAAAGGAAGARGVEHAACRPPS